MSILSNIVSSIKNAVSSANKNTSVTATKGSSSSSEAPATNSYKSGSGYASRETAYTWTDGSTTYSNHTNYQDAQKEAGKTGVGLVNAVSYPTGNSNGSSANANGNGNNGYSNSSPNGNYYSDALAYEKSVADSHGMGNNNGAYGSGGGGGYNNDFVMYLPQGSMYNNQQQFSMPNYDDYFNQFNNSLSGMQNQNNLNYSGLATSIDKLTNASYNNQQYMNSKSNQVNLSDDSLLKKTQSKNPSVGYQAKGASNAINRLLATESFNQSKFNK